MIRDLTDDEARRALVLKWGEAPRGRAARLGRRDGLRDRRGGHRRGAARRSATGGSATRAFDDDGGELGGAYAGFARRHYGQEVDPGCVLPVVDVTAGVRFLLDVLSGPGAVVMPVPAYSPQLAVAEITGRKRVDLVVDPDAERAELDLDELDRLFADGAQTLLLTQPHNPWGRVFTRAELEGVRDVVVRHGARVVSDEIHAPLVLPGAEHVSYLEPRGHRRPRRRGRRGVQGVQHRGPASARRSSPATRRPAQRLREVPMARNDSWSSLGVVGRRRGLHPRRPVAGRARQAARRPAHPARRAAGRAPARRPDAAARGDVPRLDRPARPTATSDRPRWPSSAAGCGSRRARTTTPAWPGTCASTSRPPPTGSPRSSAGWPPPSALSGP